MRTRTGSLLRPGTICGHGSPSICMYVCASWTPEAEAVRTTRRVCARRVAWMRRLNLPMTRAVCHPLRRPTTLGKRCVPGRSLGGQTRVTDISNQIPQSNNPGRYSNQITSLPWLLIVSDLKEPVVEYGLAKGLFCVVICFVVGEPP